MKVDLPPEEFIAGVLETGEDPEDEEAEQE